MSYAATIMGPVYTFTDVMFVSSAGSATAPYDTWAKASTSLQTALNAVGTSGNHLILCAGNDTLNEAISAPANAGVQATRNFILIDSQEAFQDGGGNTHGKGKGYLKITGVGAASIWQMVSAAWNYWTVCGGLILYNTTSGRRGVNIDGGVVKGFRMYDVLIYCQSYGCVVIPASITDQADSMDFYNVWTNNIADNPFYVQGNNGSAPSVYTSRFYHCGHIGASASTAFNILGASSNRSKTLTEGCHAGRHGYSGIGFNTADTTNAPLDVSHCTYHGSGTITGTVSTQTDCHKTGPAEAEAGVTVYGFPIHLHLPYLPEGSPIIGASSFSLTGDAAYDNRGETAATITTAGPIFAANAQANKTDQRGLIGSMAVADSGNPGPWGMIR